jgi:hypothetical protein
MSTLAEELKAEAAAVIRIEWEGKGLFTGYEHLTDAELDAEIRRLEAIPDNSAETGLEHLRDSELHAMAERLGVSR